MDSQVKALELEKELEMERTRLTELRKIYYHLAGASEGWEEVRAEVYSGTSDDGHSEEWTTSQKWTHCSLPIYCPFISTSEEGTTSEQ